ncbi:MAG: hypothetical protein SNG18_07545, partial [Rikenellaceae bacterium]
FRKKYTPDIKRYATPNTQTPLTSPIRGERATLGLSNTHIALWASHGYYYDVEEKMWQFQRPALYGTIEDLHSYTYVNDYLAPMLEAAGAVVVMPRERDTSRMEIIIDADGSSDVRCEVTLTEGWTTHTGGFMQRDTLLCENPFELGMYSLSPSSGGRATYDAWVDREGKYAVYVSYKASPKASSKVTYTISSNNREHQVSVNQQMGGGWIYLGHFPLRNQVQINAEAATQFSVDAVKIGGGVGSVVREGVISGAPRWTEAARYFMQYSGVSSEIYRQKHKDKKPSDYKDDYKSRGDWVNYLRDTLDIPIDISVGVHTNAGIEDPTFGTLSIHFSDKGKGEFSNKGSRMSSRDYADIVHTQMVNDIRELYTPTWGRKSMYDGKYSEAFRPDVPAIILELFSHQNMGDMRYALTPQFRFDMSRAIYKGIVRYLSDRYRRDYTIAPLPPSQISARWDNGEVEIAWIPTADPLESTATSDAFVINCDTISERRYRIKPLKKGVNRVSVRAINKGGSSLASSEVEYFVSNNNRVEYIVEDYMERRTIDTLVSSDTTQRGLLLNPRHFTYDDYTVVGEQVEYDVRCEFADNEQPGWGASSYELLFKGVKSPYKRAVNGYKERLRRSDKNYISLPAIPPKGYDYSSWQRVTIITNRPDVTPQYYKKIFGQKVDVNIIGIKDISRE